MPMKAFKEKIIVKKFNMTDVPSLMKEISLYCDGMSNAGTVMNLLTAIIVNK